MTTSKMIKIFSIEIETGITTVRAGVDAHESPHPQLGISDDQEAENEQAVILLVKIMRNLGFTMVEPKKWVKPNNWVDPNDGLESVLEMDFSDPFPKIEKASIQKQIEAFLK